MGYYDREEHPFDNFDAEAHPVISAVILVVTVAGVAVCWLIALALIVVVAFFALAFFGSVALAVFELFFGPAWAGR